jgi:hypothetical protein
MLGGKGKGGREGQRESPSGTEVSPCLRVANLQKIFLCVSFVCCCVCFVCGWRCAGLFLFLFASLLALALYTFSLCPLWPAGRAEHCDCGPPFGLQCAQRAATQGRPCCACATSHAATSHKSFHVFTKGKKADEPGRPGCAIHSITQKQRGQISRTRLYSRERLWVSWACV